VSEMVERVAKAVAAIPLYVTPSTTPGQPDCVTVMSQAHAQTIARAAIAAMREPTPAQVDAMWRVIARWQNPNLHQAAVIETWHTGIDEALK